ncbi:7TM domain-containing protein [Sphingomicrobium sp. XHP0235]|uniref:7TM domain-containing protein n=1 Tax=Sphingomicrobium aquimarinum TaxID=3133971 RepID=UPI0031FEB5BD
MASNSNERALWRRRLPYIVATVGVFAFFVIAWKVLFDLDSGLSRGYAGTFGDPQRQWGFSAFFLLATLPLGATIVVFTRMIVGAQTFGLFTPMLLSLAYLQTGPLLGPAISTGAILVGMSFAPFLKRLQLSRVAFLGALIGIVVTALVLFDMWLEADLIVAAFPIVVTALVVERWWTSWESEGLRKALRIAGATLVVAVVIEEIVASRFTTELVDFHPIVLPLGCAIAMILMGRYTGLRLTEFARFRTARKGDAESPFA